MGRSGRGCVVSRGEKIAKARELRGTGAGYREIADELGIGCSTAYAWLNPERVAPYRNGRAINPERARASDRVYTATHRSECGRCGGDRPRGKHGGDICERCIQDDVDRRGREIEAMWADGLSRKEIGARVGWSRNQTAVEIHRFREKGYELPYRYKLSKPRFKDQAAA